MGRINWAVISTLLVITILLGMAILPQTKWIYRVCAYNLNSEEIKPLFNDSDILVTSENSDLARILMIEDNQRLLVESQKFYLKYPKNVLGVALLANHSFSQKNLDLSVIKVLKAGQELDSANGWWWWIEMLVWHANGDNEKATAALEMAVKSEKINFYTHQFRSLAVEQMKASKGRLSTVETLAVPMNISGNYYHNYIDTTRSMSLLNQENRTLFCKLALHISETREIDFRGYLTRDIASLALTGQRPWPKQPSNLPPDFEGATSNLINADPENAEIYKRAAILATTPFDPNQNRWLYEHPLMNWRDNQFTKLNAIFLWLTSSFLAAMAGIIASWFFRKKNLTGYAPYFCFLLVPFASMGNISESLQLGISHTTAVFGITVFGLLLGLCRRFNLAARASYWVLFGLSISVVPLIGQPFVALVWAYVFWGSLLLNRLDPAKTPALVAVASVPAGLAFVLMFLPRDTGLFTDRIVTYAAIFVMIFGSTLVSAGALRVNRANKIQAMVVAATLIPGLVFGWTIKQTLDLDVQLGQLLVEHSVKP